MSMTICCGLYIVIIAVYSYMMLIIEVSTFWNISKQCSPRLNPFHRLFKAFSIES